MERLSTKVTKRFKMAHGPLGALVAIDGSLLEASLSMTWADDTAAQRTANVHRGFDLNRGLPRTLALTDGHGADRPGVSTFLDPGQTGVLDRGSQAHPQFDRWIAAGHHGVARLRKNTQRQSLEALPLPTGTPIFFFAKGLLGETAQQMPHPVWLVGFRNRGTVYGVATDREDLTAEQSAFIFSFRWEIEGFFAWWKRHLKVSHVISRTRPGVLLQLLAGGLTSRLLILSCHHHDGERPSLRRLRAWRWQIRQETQALIVFPIVLILHADRALRTLFLLWLRVPAIS